tara:strand:- start:634 stop:1425 length:792 start_codon:yes stop_codon:yes gene_type:complete
MTYVAKDDIIIQVDLENNFIQGNPQSYEITAYKDFIGNPLNLDEPTSFHVALYVNGNKVVQYSNPRSLGVSDILNVDKAGNTGLFQFDIDSSQSIYITPGDIYAEVVIIYENYFPQPKTYVFPKIKIGTSINNAEIVIGNNGIGGGTITIGDSATLGVLTTDDKGIHPTQTDGNYEWTGVTVSNTPYHDSYLIVEVNGVSVVLGNGTRDKDSYFSRDLGLTSIAIEDITAGDQLYWNGIISGFDLLIDDEVNLIYEVNASDSI